MDHLDPPSVAITVMTIFFSPAMAQVAGPYVVIILGSFVGASWSLGSRHKTSRLSAAIFFVRMVFTAILVTVGLTKGLSALLGTGAEDSYWLLTPVSILVGGIGDNWRKIVVWGIKFLGRFTERKTGGGV